MKITIDLPDYWSSFKLKNFIPCGSSSSAIDQKNNCAYIFGGTNWKDSSLNYLYKFNLDNENIEIIDELKISSRFNHRIFYTINNKIVIIGGIKNHDKQNYSNLEYCNDIIIYDLIKQEIKIINIKNDLLKRGQFTASYYEKENSIYIFGGFNRSDLLKFNLNDNSLNEINPLKNILNKRAGMISEVLPNDNLFIFSGFGGYNGKPICYNDYYLYNIIDNTISKKDCNEVVGRTFAKSFHYKKMKKIIIFGGTLNGMESSGSFYFYDYEKDFFNVIHINPLPLDLVEPTLIFSEKNDLLYILGGLIPKNRTDYNVNEIIYRLNFNEVNKDAWLGHP